MVEPPIEALKSVAHPLRFAILAALAGRELNVGEIEAATHIGQPTLSQQLAVLRGAGLVDSRREAKLVYYRTQSAVMQGIVDSLETLVARSSASPVKAADDKGVTGAAVFARLD